MNRFVIIMLAFLCYSCDEVSDDPRDRHFNVLFRYGVGARNELNTFDNSYTKDLILDGKITIRLVLSIDDLNDIEGKLQSLDFYTFPDTFRVTHYDSSWVLYQPYNSYFFRVQAGAKFKSLYWVDSLFPGNYDYPRWSKLQEMTKFIIDRISARPEIQNLPPARGGYL